MIEYDHGDEIPAFLLRSSHSGRKFVEGDGTLRCGLEHTSFSSLIRLAWSQSPGDPEQRLTRAAAARAPELNGQENIWQFMRQNWLSNRIFKSFDISSTIAATLGTQSSTNLGRSCPSRDATGQQSVTQSEDWYNALFDSGRRAGRRSRQ
jgi:hypothetical protein